MIHIIYRSQCERCGLVNEIEENGEDLDTPMINTVTLSSLNYKGEIIKELEGDKYYICDDCWNDLLNFFDTK